MAVEHAIEVRRASGVTPFEPGNFGELVRFAEYIAESGLVPTHLRNRPKDIVLIALRAKELGIPMVAAMSTIYLVEGKVSISAELAVALVKRHPECEYFRLVESTDDAATYECKRRGAPAPVRLTWSIAQAKQAGLAGKGTWQKHAAAMLRARCALALVRAEFPDAMLATIEHDEAEEITGRPSPVAERGAEMRTTRHGSLAEYDEPIAPPAPIEHPALAELRDRLAQDGVVPSFDALVQAFHETVGVLGADDGHAKAAGLRAAYAHLEETLGLTGQRVAFKAATDALEKARAEARRHGLPTAVFTRDPIDQAVEDYAKARSRDEVDAIAAECAKLGVAKGSPAHKRLAAAYKAAVARLAPPAPPTPPTGTDGPATPAGDAPDAPDADPERAAIASEPAAGAVAKATPSDVLALRVAEEALRQCHGPQHVAAHYAAHLGELPISVRGEYGERAVMFLCGRYPKAIGSRERARTMLAAALLHRGQVAA